MVDTAPVIYTHADASTLNIFALRNTLTITYIFPGKTVERQNDKIGITVDPNRVYRIVDCSAYLTGDEVNTLNTAMMPATAPTYDATDPKIAVALDGDTTLTILCVVTGLKHLAQAHGKWLMSIQFTERST